MKKFSVFFIAMIFSLALIVSGCGGGGQTQDESNGDAQNQPEQIVAKFTHVVSAETPKGKTIQYFADLVEEKSDGRMKIEVFPSGQLYGDNEEMEAVAANNVQFIAPSSTKIVSIDPAFQIYDIMFLFPNEESLGTFFKDPEGGQKMLSRLESKGLVGLGFIPSGFKIWFNSKRPIHTPSDLEGLKFRAAAGGVLTEQYAALGSSSVSIPFGEVYTALQLGTVDGSENSPANIFTQKYYEVQKYLTISNHGRFDYTVVSNTKFMDGLPEDLRGIVKESMNEAMDYGIKINKEENEKYLEQIIATGKMEVNELTPEEREAFVQGVQPVWEKWRSVIGEDVFQRALEAGK